MEPAAEPLALIAGGHTALAACAVLYLAWWWLFFKPGAPKPRGGRYGAGVACIVGAAVLGIAGAALLVAGIAGLLPAGSQPVVLGGMAACGLALYAVLLTGTVKLFKRPVTTELLLFTAWAVLELGVLAAPVAIALGALAVAVLLASLACYLLYYRLEPRRAYAAGAVPLAAVGLFAAAMAVVAALIR